MIIQAQESGRGWPELIEVVKQDALQENQRSIPIFVSKFGCDEVAASQILQDLLHKQDLSYLTDPITSYDQAKQKLNKILENDSQTHPTLRNVFCLNFGATVDIRAHLDLPNNTKRGKAVRIIVIDHHRPVHPSYTNADDNNTLILIGQNDPQLLVSDPGEIEVEQDDEDESSQYDSDDQENVPPQDGRKRGRGADKSTTRKKPRNDLNTRLAKKAYWRSGIYSGKPSSQVMWECAYVSNASSIQTIWSACVGLTELKHLCYINDEQYEQYIHDIVNMGGSSVRLVSEQDEEQPSSHTPDDSITSHITISPQLNIPLLHDWSLKEAVRHHVSWAGVQRTWTSHGENTTLQMLIKCGVFYDNFDAQYVHLPERYHSQLPDRLQQHASNLGVLDIMSRYCVQFHRSYATPCNALDTVVLMHAAIADKHNNAKLPSAHAHGPNHDFSVCKKMLSNSTQKLPSSESVARAKGMLQHVLTDVGALHSAAGIINFKKQLITVPLHKINNMQLKGSQHLPLVHRYISLILWRAHQRRSRNVPVVVVAPAADWDGARGGGDSAAVLSTHSMPVLIDQVPQQIADRLNQVGHAIMGDQASTALDGACKRLNSRHVTHMIVNGCKMVSTQANAKATCAQMIEVLKEQDADDQIASEYFKQRQRQQEPSGDNAGAQHSTQHDESDQGGTPSGDEAQQGSLNQTTPRQPTSGRAKKLQRRRLVAQRERAQSSGGEGEGEEGVEGVVESQLEGEDGESEQDDMDEEGEGEGEDLEEEGEEEDGEGDEESEDEEGGEEGGSGQRYNGIMSDLKRMIDGSADVVESGEEDEGDGDSLEGDGGSQEGEGEDIEGTQGGGSADDQ